LFKIFAREESEQTTNDKENKLFACDTPSEFNEGLTEGRKNMKLNTKNGIAISET
jgi:hypothetical protein